MFATRHSIWIKTKILKCRNFCFALWCFAHELVCGARPLANVNWSLASVLESSSEQTRCFHRDSLFTRFMVYVRREIAITCKSSFLRTRRRWIFIVCENLDMYWALPGTGTGSVWQRYKLLILISSLFWCVLMCVSVSRNEKKKNNN